MATSYQLQRRRCAVAFGRLASLSDWNSADLHWYGGLIDRFFNNLAAYERRMGKPHQGNARLLRDRMLNSYSGALCSHLQEAHARGLKKLKPMSPAELELKLRSARPTRRIFDYAVIKTQGKANGEKRITLSPGPKNRAAQRLVSDLLDASGIANPFDYNRAGKGKNAAIAEIVRLVEEDGTRDFVVFDLENNFTSVGVKHLNWVPLPKKVMKHSVFFNRDVILLHNNINAAEAEAARHGLPQGARVSGILASSLLGRELRQLDGAKGIVAYVDDGVIGACDPAGANALAQAIMMRFANYPGGPLGLKKLDVHSIDQGFSFLGYWLRLDHASEVPTVQVMPSHEAREKFRRRLMAKLAAISPKPDWDKAVIVAHAYGKQWRMAFTLWQPSEAQLEVFEGWVEVYVGEFLSGFTCKHPPKPVCDCIG